MMISKRKIKAFISFNWYWFLIFAFLSFFVFYSIYDLKNQVKYDEKICVFIEADFVNKEELSKEMYYFVDQKVIKEVSIDFSSPTSMHYSLIFNTRGLVNTDIVIITKDYLQEMYYSKYFAKIDEKFMEEYTYKQIEYCKDEKNDIYGINITNKMAKYVNSESEYYLFFNKKSNKIGSLSSETINDQAINAALGLI